MEYILIILLTKNPNTAGIAMQEFKTIKTCIAAKTKIRRNHGKRLYAYCLKK